MTLAVALFSVGIVPASAQSIPRGPDGKPNLNGIWQAMNTANWDVQPHAAQKGLVVQLGAQDAEPGGIGVVEGGEIPYKPAALAQKKKNYDARLTNDPEVKCYMPGIPRATYMPYPFQIVQSQNTILMAYEFASASRTVYLKNPPPVGPDSWMGYSVAHWDGDTLVIDVTNQVDQTWFDRAGDYHSGDMKVTERYSMAGPNVINYDATIDDPATFTRPWKISMPLYRHMEKNAQLMEFKCVEFVEELLYGKYRKK